MKKTLAIIMIILLATILFGCSKSGIEKHETNLEFWICDNADNIDFSNCQERFGIMGGREYYGSVYKPAKDENGVQIDPEECVIYTVTSYPDYSSKAKHITSIKITDPEINVYGLTIDSSEDTIKSTMSDNGFKLIDAESPNVISFKKGKISIVFTQEYIRIKAKVTNMFGIQFKSKFRFVMKRSSVSFRRFFFEMYHLGVFFQ